VKCYALNGALVPNSTYPLMLHRPRARVVSHWEADAEENGRAPMPRNPRCGRASSTSSRSTITALTSPSAASASSAPKRPSSWPTLPTT